MNDIIMLAVQLGVTVAAFLVGKYVFPNIPKSVTEKLNSLSAWAAQFVVWAKQFMQTQSGEEKMAAVVEKLKEIADEAGLEVTEDQLKAIAQSAYNAMKAGEKEADIATAQPLEAVQAAAPTVNVFTGTQKAAEGVTAVATDKVPDGALEQNEDGSVNVYNEAGEKVGTVPAEEAEAAAKKVTTIVIEEDGK
ncbi:MAG: hypothetical protein BACD_02323 [Bacteroides rodentium]